MKTTEETQTIDEFEVLVKRSHRRSLSLEITPKGILARAPMRMTQKDISSFVRAKKTWLHKHLLSRPKVLEPLNLQNGTKLPYKNNSLELIVELGKRGQAKRIGDQLTLPIQASRLSLTQSVHNKVLKWYRQESLSHFEKLVSELAPLMDLKPSKNVKVRDYKRRWGSCDHQGNLSFNWRLIMAPEVVSRYVVVHELAHRHEFNHSPRFWQIVAHHHPNWQNQRDWLYSNSPKLYRL